MTAKVLVIVLLLIISGQGFCQESSAGFLKGETGVSYAEARKKGVKILRRISKDSAIVAASVSSLFQVEEAWKLSAKVKSRAFQPGVYTIVLKQPQSLKLDALAMGRNIFQIQVNTIEERNDIAKNINVMYLDGPSEAPIAEALVSGMDLSVNAANLLRANATGKGDGRLVSVKEDSFDPADIDLTGRYVDSGLASNQESVHATEMATIIGGAGNLSYRSHGIAPGVQLTSSSFERIFPDPDESFRMFKIFLQNHSYGFTVPDNQYGAEASEYDRQMFEMPSLLHVISAGNIGEAVSDFGPYAGVEGFANISGSFKMAKNPLLVGATSVSGVIDPRNSRGPAYDGRIKPELVAYGVDGTSDAAALVSGIVVLLQEKFKIQYNREPTSALLKSALIAGADPLNNEGIDHLSGYGMVNAIKAERILEQATFLESYITNGLLDEHQISIPEGTANLRVALTWTDPPANPGDVISLINNLDLKLVSAGNNEVLPWVLSTFPHADSLAKPSLRRRDELNTVELISLKDPDPGMYTIQISGSDVLDLQHYALAWSVENISEFTWTYPLSEDALRAQSDVALRWQTQLSGPGEVMYRVDDGEWLVIDQVEMADGHYTWKVPDTLVNAALGIRHSSGIYMTDKFVITPGITTTIQAVCDSELQLTWNRIPGVSEYRLYQAGLDDLTLIGTVSDTTIALSRSEIQGEWLRVFPILNGVEGYGEAAINYTEQGVNCFFIDRFSRNIDDEFVRSEVTLSTTFGVNEISFERSVDGGFFEILDVQEVREGFIEYQFDDYQPLSEFSIYRIVLRLANGELIEISRTQVYFPFESTFGIYPNPVESGGFFTFLTLPEDKEIRLLNLFGQEIRRWRVFANRSEFDLPLVSGGIYIIQVLKAGGGIQSFRLMIN